MWTFQRPIQKRKHLGLLFQCEGIFISWERNPLSKEEKNLLDTGPFILLFQFMGLSSKAQKKGNKEQLLFRN